jgi:cation diffusion facilitator family transporter
VHVARGDVHERDHTHDHGGRGLLARLGQAVRGHSHDPTQRSDSALATSRRGLRALWVSLAGLALTALVELVVVVITGSVGLLGDTLHNLADALTALPLGVAFLIGRRAPNRRYTYGYGRAEDLAALAIVAAIAASTAAAGYESVLRLIHPRTVYALWAVAAAALVGFAGNECVASYRIRVGRSIGSAALVADGRHARTDGLTSLAVAAGAAGVALGWRQADAVAGLAITVAILAVLRTAARDVYRRLMDAVSPGLVSEAEAVVAAVPGVEEVGQVRVRWIGHDLRAEVRLVVDADLTVVQAHDIAEAAHHRLLHEVPRLSEALVHADPCSHDGVDHHRETAHHETGHHETLHHEPTHHEPTLDEHGGAEPAGGHAH